jgi:hypothetical protein
MVLLQTSKYAMQTELSFSSFFVETIMNKFLERKKREAVRKAIHTQIS